MSRVAGTNPDQLRDTARDEINAWGNMLIISFGDDLSEGSSSKSTPAEAVEVSQV